jgi:hypothetical protein
MKQAEQRGIYLLLDFHPYLGYASSQRQLRDIVQRRHCQPHVVVLVGAKVELPAELEAVAVRFNAMGANFAWPQPLPVGAHGILEVTLRDIVVQPVNLPAEVVNGAAAGQVRVRFVSLGETVTDHIEKLVFRRHRRKIAGARQHSSRK